MARPRHAKATQIYTHYAPNAHEVQQVDTAFAADDALGSDVPE